MIDKIKIQGYKSIKDIELALKPINLLIGANGSGKSIFLSFFEFLNYLYEQKLQEYIALRGGQEKFFFQGVKTTESIKSHVSFNNGRNGYSFTLTAGEDEPIFTEEGLWYRQNEWHEIPNKKEASIKFHNKDHHNYNRSTYIRGFLKSFKKFHFHDTGPKSRFNNHSHIQNDTYFLYENGGNIPTYLFRIYNENPMIYKRIIYTIQSIAPYFSDFYFQPNESGYLKLQWTDKYSNTIYGVNDLSDGTLRFIALCVLFLQPELPETIIIDEPELGLHPTAITKLSGLIKSVVQKKTQVIVATQSADLINHFKPEDVVTVDQINGASEFHRLDKQNLEQWLEEYSIGDLWMRNILEKGQPNE